MSSKILEGMARAFWKAARESAPDCDSTPAIRAALLWLADNVTDEMGIAAVVDWQNDKSGGNLQEWLQSAIKAAIRKAAEGK